MGYAAVLQLARQMRKNPTQAEVEMGFRIVRFRNEMALNHWSLVEEKLSDLLA